MVKPWIAVIVGSENDKEKIKDSKLEVIFEDCGVKYAISTISAYRHPDRLRRYCEDAVKRGVVLFIAGAGMAAHLPGSIATITNNEYLVFGVALSSNAFLDAKDATLSISRMPAGCPVALAGIDDHGFTNAAIMACQTLMSRGDTEADRIKKRLAGYRENYMPESEENYPKEEEE